MSLLNNFLDLFLESAPWLIVGLVLAGMLKMFISMNWMNKQLGGHGLMTTIKAALLGAPLPLCSCGVIPAAIGLRRSGASRSATTSFMVSTPETGIDSISVSYVLLGPFMAVIRPVAAIFSAILAGLLVGREDSRNNKLVTEDTTKGPSSCSSTSEPKPLVSEKASCCATQASLQATKKSACCSTKAVPEPSVPTTSQGSCCSSTQGNTEKPASSCGRSKKTEPLQKQPNFLGKVVTGLRYSATELIDDTAVWLLIGLSFASIVQTYVPDDFLASWGNGLLAMLVMVIISIPMYICATASTPIAAGLLIAGVAPGAVLVFMLAGPATNIATLGVVSKELGKRALGGYLAGVLGGALLFGFLTDFLVTAFGFSVMPQIGPEHELLPQWLTVSCGLVLAILMMMSLIKKGQSRFNK
ncbi:SO_0444 family Cu/Zn efflux transporter [Marinomonas sp.]